MPETAVALEPGTASNSVPNTWSYVLNLPCELTVDLPLPGFKVDDLLQLKEQVVIPSRWSVAADVPLRVNGALIAWSEFEVAGNRLAVRLTEVA